MGSRARHLIEQRRVDGSSGLVSDTEEPKQSGPISGDARSALDEQSADQLAAIAELADIAERLNVEVWLGGGWAMDFYLGMRSRPHLDIDWFAPASSSEQLIGVLIERGFSVTGTAPRDQQADLIRGHVNHGIGWINRLSDGSPVVAGGPFAGEPWPKDMLEGPRLTLEGVTANIISPHSQIEIKRMTPVWRPDLGRRMKDVHDIAAIRRRMDGKKV